MPIPRLSTKPTYHAIESPWLLVVEAFPKADAAKLPVGVQFSSVWVLQGSPLVFGRPFPLEMTWGPSFAPSLQVSTSCCEERSISICVIQRDSAEDEGDSAAKAFDSNRLPRNVPA